MFNTIIHRTQLVECPLEALTNGQPYAFQDVPNLAQNDIVIYAITSYTTADLTVAPSGNAIVPVGTGLSVTLTDAENLQFAQDTPYLDFNRRTNNGIIIPIAPRILSLTKCFVTVNDNAGLTANQSALFNVYYQYVRKGIRR